MAKKISLSLLIFLALGGWVFGFQYELAKPSYDSGWVGFAPNEIKILTHNLGGNIDDYVVDMQFRDDGGNKVNQVYFGGRDGDSAGANWDKLTTSSIRIYRGPSDVNCDEIRLRIWRIERANFDSGWRNIAQGQTLSLTHNIGGNPDDFVVYLEFKDIESYGIHQRSYGGSVYSSVSVGAFWKNLGSSTVQVFRCPDDLGADQIRVRIWRMNHPDYDSGWQVAGSQTTCNHNLGGPWNDYVVDLQFKDNGEFGVNQQFYGGGPASFEPGANWWGLNASQLSVYRQTGANQVDQLRVRIWKCSAPKYDSGWFSLSVGTSQTLTHGLGGNADDYVVDLQFKDSLFSINNRYYGGRKCYDALSAYIRYRGAYWYALTNNQVKVYRSGDDGLADQVRVRLWLAPKPDYDSGWMTISASAQMYFSIFPALSNVDDCVVYMEFKNSSGGGVHHTDYGGDKWWNNLDVLYLYGAYWDNLKPESIRLNRAQNDTLVEQVRVRIWKNDPIPVPRYAWKHDWTIYEPVVPMVRTHNLGGNVDDYVLDMRFYIFATFYQNQRFYGSIYAKHEKSGAFYQNLNSSSLEVVRELNDGNASQIMLRIWKTGYTPKTVYVSGHISYAGNPLPDVAVGFSGTGGGTCYTDANGNYFMSLPYNYSGTATPARMGYVFSPTQQVYSSLVANATADYTAAAVPFISVTSPTAASDWQTGTAYDIAWTTSGVIGNVKVELFQGGVFNSTIASSTANDGLLSWTPSYFLATAANYQVKISDVNNASINNTSPNFTITKTALPSISKDFNGDGQEDIIWRYYGPGGYNVVWYLGDSGGGLAHVEGSFMDRPIGEFKSVNMLQGQGPKQTFVDPREPGMMVNEKEPQPVFRDAREAGGLAEKGGRESQRTSGARDIPVMKGADELQAQGSPRAEVAGLTWLGMDFLPAVDDPSWTIVGTGDFNGDGRVDILWRYSGSGGYNLVWYMNGVMLLDMEFLPAVTDLLWKIAGTGDFNGDGKVDILWRYVGSGGYNVVWYMNGVAWLATDFLPAVDDPSWTIAATGDFNGDTKADILWRYGGSGGYNLVWYMNGATWLGMDFLPSVTDPLWKIAGTGDFNGDAKVDILWRYYGPEGTNVVWLMDGIAWQATEFLPALADPNWKIENH